MLFPEFGMTSKKPIVHQLVADIKKEHDLPRIVILQAISEAVDEITKQYEQCPAAYTPAISEALNKIRIVTVTRGDSMPAYQLEALKELIKKVALRKLQQLEEQELKKQRPKATYGKRKQKN